MNRAAFIQALRNHLSDLPADEVEKSLNYFNEMIDDRMEEGMTEEEAVSDIGDVRLIAEKILDEEKPSEHRHRLTDWQRILLILGSPLWLALVLTALSLYLAFLLAAGSLALAGAFTILASPLKLMVGLSSAVFTAAVGFIVLGCGLIALSGARALSQRLVSLYRRIRNKRWGDFL